MRKFILAAVILSAIAITSCSRSISVYDAANGKAKCGRTLR